MTDSNEEDQENDNIEEDFLNNDWGQPGLKVRRREDCGGQLIFQNVAPLWKIAQLLAPLQKTV